VFKYQYVIFLNFNKLAFLDWAQESLKFFIFTFRFDGSVLGRGNFFKIARFGFNSAMREKRKSFKVIKSKRRFIYANIMP